jgi:hypothetical protein
MGVGVALGSGSASHALRGHKSELAASQPQPQKKKKRFQNGRKPKSQEVFDVSTSTGYSSAVIVSFQQCTMSRANDGRECATKDDFS